MGVAGDGPEGATVSFKAIRVAILSVILASVVFWALGVQQRRKQRTTWTETLPVALVVVDMGGVDAELGPALNERAAALESHLHAEYRRYKPGAIKPFEFTIYGPVAVSERPPPLPFVEGIQARLEHAWALHQYLTEIDERVQLPTRAYDSRIYLVARAPAGDKVPRFVEGIAEEGGELGIVELDLADDTIDLAFAAGAHELLHTLGATDRYDEAGQPIAPDGYAESNLQPLFPQKLAEIMARSIPISATESRLPDSLSEVIVGPKTAAEIGWSR